MDRAALPAERLRHELVSEATGGLWTSVSVVAETGSTNTDLARAAREGAGEGTVLVAEHQRAGRGRVDRSWQSPPRAGLTVSVLLRPGEAGGGRPPVPPARWSWLSLLAGVALAESVRGVTGLPALVKWPNDLLVAGAKCAGILAEVVDSAVVCGIGLNVSNRPDELPPPGDGLPATSLVMAGAAHPDRARLLIDLLRRLADWYGRWRAAEGDPDRCRLRPTYQRLCATVGEPVRVHLPAGGELVGTAEGIDRDGRLLVREESGALRPLAAGDVLHLRPRPPGVA